MRKSGNIIFISFIFFFLYFFVVYDVDFHGPDEPSYFAYPSSVIEDGDLNVVNQSYKSRQFAVSKTYNLPMSLNHGGVVLWAPFYAYAKFAHFIASKFNMMDLAIYGIEGLAKCALSFSTVVFGLIAMLLTYFLCRFFCSNRISLWSTAAIFFGTPFFYYTLLEGGNANIIACLFSILSIWFCSHWAKMRRSQLFLYGAFFSVCVAVKSELWIQAFFIIAFFIALLLSKKTDWKGMIYFLMGFIPILILRAINAYLTYGTPHMEEVIYIIAALRCRLSYNFNGLFSSFRGLLYTSPIFYICLLGFVLVSAKALRNIKAMIRSKSTQDIFFFILTSYAVIKLLFVGRMFSPGGDTLSARALVAEFPVFVLLYGYALQMQKKSLRVFLGVASLLFIFWNLLIVSEYMAGLDWLYITGAPGIMTRAQSFRHILNSLFYANNWGMKIMLCLPLVLIISWLVFYIVQRSRALDNFWFWHREGQDKSKMPVFYFYFAIYTCLAYTVITSLNMINNKKNAKELRAKGFFEDARIIDVSPIKMTEFEEDEHLRFFFDLKRYYVLKNDIRMLNYIRKFKEEIYGEREALHDHYHAPARPYRSLADSYSKNGRYKKAIDSYKDILRLASRDIDAFIGLGDIYVITGDYAKAIETFEEAVQIYPDSINLWARLADAYKETNNFDKAIEYLQKDLELNPGSAPSHVNLGNIYTSKADYDRAIEHYQAAIKINPESIDAYSSLAEAYARKTDYSKVIEYYKRALELSPGSIKFYTGLADAYTEFGMKEEAISYLKKILELNPGSAPSHVNLGNIYTSKADYDRAIEHYQAAIKINPESIDAYSSLAEAYARKTDYSKVIEYYKRALELSPGSIKFYTGLADAYTEFGMKEEAISYLKKILELNPGSAPSHVNLGNIYTSKADYDRAIEHYQAAIKINPESISNYMNLGEAYDAKGYYDKAKECYEQVVELNPVFPAAYINLGHLYNHEGDYDKAIKCFEKFIHLNPNDTAVYRALGEIHINRGDTENTLKQVIKLKELDRNDLAKELEEYIKELADEIK